MKAALVVVSVLLLATAAAAEEVEPVESDAVLRASALGAGVGLALPVIGLTGGMLALFGGQGDIGLQICGICGIAGGALTLGPFGSCGAAVGSWLGANTAMVDPQAVLAGAAPGLAVAVASTVLILILSTSGPVVGTAAGATIGVIAIVAGLAATPITVCGATMATPNSGRGLEIPVPTEERASPPPAPPEDEPPPPLLEEMRF